MQSGKSKYRSVRPCQQQGLEGNSRRTRAVSDFGKHPKLYHRIRVRPCKHNSSQPVPLTASWSFRQEPTPVDATSALFMPGETVEQQCIRFCSKPAALSSLQAVWSWPVRTHSRWRGGHVERGEVERTVRSGDGFSPGDDSQPACGAVRHRLQYGSPRERARPLFAPSCPVGSGGRLEERQSTESPGGCSENPVRVKSTLGI